MIILTWKICSKQLESLRYLIHQTYQLIEILLNRLSIAESEFIQ